MIQNGIQFSSNHSRGYSNIEGGEKKKKNSRFVTELVGAEV